MVRLQAYGEGYQPEVVLESPLIDLSSSMNLTTLHWEADIPPGTRIEGGHPHRRSDQSQHHVLPERRR